ncbi:MAG: 50S ribosomal protein L6 [Patescibacteria group bacterium]
MSRLAKKPIAIPEGISVEMKEGLLVVRGPSGQISRKVPPGIHFDFGSANNKEIYVRADEIGKEKSAYLGTFASHLKNMIRGAKEGYKKQLSLEGIGFRAEIKNGALVLNLGFSNPVIIPAPAGINFSVEKNTITVSGSDKELVGNTAAKIRASKKPEPYKGKGIRYVGEIIRRKAGKKVAAAAA